MKSTVVQAAHTNLPELLARVAAGEEIVLAQGKNAVARLVPLPSRPAKRQFGALRRSFSVGAEFFEPLPEAELVPPPRFIHGALAGTVKIHCDLTRPTGEIWNA